MRKISEREYSNYLLQAMSNTANCVYPCSVVQGFQSGDVFDNDGKTVESVLFWHYCGFAYVSGKPSLSFLTDIYELMISDEKDRRLVLITDDDETIHFFEEKDARITLRAEYSYNPQSACDLRLNDYEIERIDKNNISKIEGRIIPSFSWKTNDEFLKNGFGYIAVKDGKMCSVAFSSAVSKEEIDIGVSTHEEFRGLSLASALTNIMCREIVKKGKAPVFAHSVSNTGSMKVASKCGFIKKKINTVIQRRS